jgi:hypothetical protein
MGPHAVSSELLQVGEDPIGRIAREIDSGAPLVRLQLLASHFYEELVEELQRTPRSEPAKLGLLAAAADQYRRSVSFGAAPPSILSELQAALAMLTGTIQLFEPAPRVRPQLRVIQGGLS